MRHAARQSAEAPAPTRESLEARAGRALDEHAVFLAEIRAVHDEIRDALRLLPAAACDQRLAATLAGRLEVTAEQQRHLWTLAGDNSLHLEEARGAMAGFTAANAGNAHLLAALRAREKALEDAARQIPRQRRSGGGGHARQTVLMRVLDGGKAGIVPVAAAFWAATRPVRHAALHPAAIKLTAHVKMAAAAAAVPAGGLLIAGAVVVTGSGGPAQAGPDRGHGANPAASIEAATPIPSSSLIARTVTHPPTKHRGARKVLLSGAGIPVPSYGPVPVPSSPGPSSASPSASVQAGPATLTVSTTSLDLSGDVTSATVTVTATGGGWASWHISTSGTDLTFTPDHGVLVAGQSVTITVSRAAVLDAVGTQTFEVAGTVVTVSLPLPAPVASAAPVPAASDLPSLAPTAMPS